jgi:hypothetical protein
MVVAAAPEKDTGDEANNRRCINAAPVLVALLGSTLTPTSTEIIDVGVDVREMAGAGVAGLGSGGC